METRLTKFIFQKKMYPVTIETDKDFHYLQTPFLLKDEVKAMKGAKWMGYDSVNPRPVWRVENCRRNNFNIEYLEGKNPFKKYIQALDVAALHIPPTRKDMWTKQEVPLFKHQPEFVAQILTRKQCIIAGEMGTAKTLAVFIAMERSLVPEIWYVAPKSALTSVKLDAMRWGVKCNIKFMTYDELKKILKDWTPGRKPPRFVVYDESSRVKTPTSQRSQAAFYLAEAMRDEYGEDCYIVEMSGSPAPKSPLDWYWQCEIACPGFIREGDMWKFQARLAIMQRVEDITRTSYNKLIAWKDGNPNICNVCGLASTEECHQDGMHNSYHAFVPIENEVEKLYRRMSGLVFIKFKKDCLDLPDKIYRIVKLKPSLDLLRAASIVMGQSRTAIQQLTLLRELSDGFQYRDKIADIELCTFCEGNKIRYENNVPVPCAMCNATGSKNKIEREVIEVSSPKLDAVTDLLEENDDIGRIVLYAGFTASIDRLCKHVQKQGWEFIRVDGRGWSNSINHNWTDIESLRAFQDKASSDKKIAFIAHPGSAGMGLTLTAASMLVYVSNDFNGESRIQSEDRIHRPGMDTNRGATIVDLILLPTDLKVRENLFRKKELQSISLGELQAAMDNYNAQTDISMSN